jgi:hypothetical protein
MFLPVCGQLHYYFYCPRNPTQHCHMQVAAAPDIPPQESRLPDRASHQAALTHPSKLRKLEDGTSTPGNVNNSHGVYSAPSQIVVPGGPSGSYSSGAVNFQQPENEVAQVMPFYFNLVSICFLLFSLHRVCIFKHIARGIELLLTQGTCIFHVLTIPVLLVMCSSRPTMSQLFCSRSYS